MPASSALEATHLDPSLATPPSTTSDCKRQTASHLLIAKQPSTAQSLAAAQPTPHHARPNQRQRHIRLPRRLQATDTLGQTRRQTTSSQESQKAQASRHQTAASQAKGQERHGRLRGSQAGKGTDAGAARADRTQAPAAQGEHGGCQEAALGAHGGLAGAGGAAA